MSNIFEHHQSKIWERVERFYGYDATWKPYVEDGAEEKEAISGRVLFNDPAEKEETAGLAAYERDNPKIEWEKGQLEGLFEATQSLVYPEILTINGIEYQMLQARKKADGKTYEANLQVNGAY